MKSLVAALPTPEQIAETLELATVHALDHAIELTVRTLVAVHPGLDDSEAPYWVAEASRAQRDALRLVAAAHHLRERIERYLAALDLERRSSAARFEDDLPF
jgi:hypothetical protein